MDNTLEKFKNNLQAYADICNGGRGKYDPLTVFHNQAEYNEACNILHTHARLCGSNTFGKGNSIRGNQSMRMTRNTFRLEIQYHRPQPRQQNVRESSKEAYRVLDTAKAQRAVLDYVLEASRNGSDITRAEIAFALGMEKSSVAGRVNELLETSKERNIEYDGQQYRLVETTPRHSRCPGAAPSKAAPVRLVMVAPHGFKPAVQTQTQLF